MTLTTGAMFLMWLGEQITERGIGNGISMIILSRHRRGPAGRDRPHARAGQHGRDESGVRDHPVLIVIVLARHRVLRVRRARPAPHPGQLREAPGRPAHVRGPDQPSAVQAQHVGRDPADLRVEPAAVPGDASRASSARQRHLAAGCRRSPRRSRCGQPLHIADVRRPDHLLLLLLHGAGVQLARDGRQPEEGRAPSSPASGRASRPANTSTRC